MLLIAGASFGLGRLTVLEMAKAPISIEYFSSTTSSDPGNQPGQQASAALAPIPGIKGLFPVQQQIDQLPATTSTLLPTVRIVASKKGKRYYYETCNGARNLSPANKVYYKTPADAEKAGLTIATGCSAPR